MQSFIFAWSEMIFVSMSQSIITELNDAIGASGVVSLEYKAVVAQYGETILKMLLSKVYVT